MILFKSVSYKNFLAAGNNPIKVNLDSHGTTLIVGQNGGVRVLLSKQLFLHYLISHFVRLIRVS